MTYGLCHDGQGHTVEKSKPVPKANDQLQQARERTESPSHPGECLSRQEVAELVNAYVWEHHRKKVEIDANYIGKLERGVIRWPSAYYREALRSIFGVSTDAALGLFNPRRRLVKVADMDRKTFLRAAGVGFGAAALAPHGRPVGHQPGHRPADPDRID